MNILRLVLTVVLCVCSVAASAEWTQLHEAAAKGNVAQIEFLVDAGMNVNAKSASKTTPLHEAAVLGKTAAIKALAAKGADVDAKDVDGRTPLYTAALAEQASAVVSLIGLGSDVNTRNSQGRTPLHLAAFFGDVAMIEALTKWGANLDAKENKYRDTPLHYAAINGHVSAIQALLRAGANANTQNKLGRLPRHYAEKKGHTRSVNALSQAAKIRTMAKAAVERHMAEVTKQSEFPVEHEGGSGSPSREGAEELATTDDEGRANRLMIEAIKAIESAEIEPSAQGKYELLRQAFDNLTKIIERFPATELAVKLATGQRIGNVSLAGVRKAMDQMRVSGPRKDGAPMQVWRLGAGVVAVALLPGGRQAVTVDRNGVMTLHDIETGRLLRTWRQEGGLSDVDLTRRRSGGASTVAVSPRGRAVLTAGKNGNVVLHDVGTGRVLSEWQHGQAVGAVALSRVRDRGLALVGAGREALLVDTRELKVRRSWRGKSPVTSVAVAPDGQWILAGFADGSAVLGDASTGKTLHTWKHRGSGGGGIMSAAFSPDGRRVLIGAANRTAVLRDVSTGKTLHEWQIGNRVTSVAYSRDGRWVLTGDEEYEVELHDTQTGRTVRKWRYDTSAEAVAFAPSDRQVLMGFADGMVILCDIQLPKKGRGNARTYLNNHSGCW